MEEIILIGIGGMLLFAVGIIAFVVVHQRRVIQYQLNLQKLKEEQQKLLLHATIESEEKERQRIAGDLHDEVGASLSTIRLYLQQASKKQTLEQVESITVAAKGILDDVVAKVRQISHRLSPEMLMKFGLKDALQNSAQKLKASEGIEVEFISPDEISRFQPDRELAVYRIIQEIIGNMLKHASATKVTLQLQERHNDLIIKVEDNGKGFSQDLFEKLKSIPGGLGLKNIQSRVDILQANINFTSNPAIQAQEGTIMTLTVPVIIGNEKMEENKTW
ncbi:MAG: sensor histidine kinase [Chitinophagaceae bacterium]